jgi:uncharacterized protein YacL
MTDEKKAEILLTLEKYSWDNLDRRRIYEWKFNISLWTVLTALIGILLSNPMSVNLEFMIRQNYFFCILILVTIIISHLYWLYNLTLRNKLDIEFAKLFESEIREIVKIELTAEIKKLHKKKQKQFMVFHDIYCDYHITLFDHLFNYDV